MPGLLTAAELSRDRIEGLITRARAYAAGTGRRHPEAVVALAFFDDSLRTRVGFELAAARLGARTTTITELKQTEAMGRPETLEDTLRSIASWCEAICLRHPDADAIRHAAAMVATPIVNCGNGRDEHPTQALVDLMTLQEEAGRIDGTRIAFVGDLSASRTARSLALALARFTDVTVRCIHPEGLGLSDEVRAALRAGGHRLEERHAMDVEGCDAVYVAGLPAHTRAGVLTREQQGAFHVTRRVVEQLPERGVVLCPLPRIDEIDRDVDDLPAAAYFRNGPLALAMRMAVLDETFAA
jgi:aspartate carbamoyltransferase catalytic subunit